MTRNDRFKKISNAIISELADQLMKVIQKGTLVDMHYELNKRLTDAQIIAYDHGYEKGRQSVLDKLEEFDNSKDDVSS